MARKRAMIVFSIGSWRFTYRVGAIIIRDGHVLLMRMTAEDFWFVPGGRWKQKGRRSRRLNATSSRSSG
jgi:hypothetical protein